MANSKIEWTESTWNPVTGCSKISTGCKNCYAERMSKRLAGRFGYPKDNPFRVTLHEDKLEEPLKIKKPTMFFVCSMGDLFHEDVSFNAIQRVWATMQAPACHKHTFQILTKRPERMLEYYKWNESQPSKMKMAVEFQRPNIWLGVTCENQEMADKRIPTLLEIPAAKRFVSIEPMLGPVDVILAEGDIACVICATQWHYDDSRECPGCGSDDPYQQVSCNDPYKSTDSELDWVICGGETGPGARPMHPDWVKNLRDQCQEANVPFFFKQWGEWVPTDMLDINKDGKLLTEISNSKHTTWLMPDGSTSIDFFEEEDSVLIGKVGKKRAGRKLDGKECNEMPEVK